MEKQRKFIVVARGVDIAKKGWEKTYWTDPSAKCDRPTPLPLKEANKKLVDALTEYPEYEYKLQEVK